jgi:hypothetical protein
MVSIRGALVEFGLDLHIQFFMRNSLEVLEESYLPSAKSFKRDIYSTMLELVQFMSNTEASFWINAYQCFDCKDNPKIRFLWIMFCLIPTHELYTHRPTYNMIICCMLK